MEPVRVMIVDDSAFAREVIGGILAEDDAIKVVGYASNGMEALEKIRKFKPNLVTMDINMPIMDGLEAIPRIMASYPVPILVVTSIDDANVAYNAISGGALEVMQKPSIGLDTSKELINNVKLLSKVKVITHIRGEHTKKTFGSLTGPWGNPKKNPSESVIAIASSTGGPKALSILLASFPKDFPSPIVVAQHIDDEFVFGMAEWLNSVSQLNVKIGESGEYLTGGMVYLAPSKKHMIIDRFKRIAFRERVPTDIYFPSCNALLSSVADVSKANSVGIILTGMGDDGVAGIKKIKETGGYTIAQDEKTSVVFGMPKAAIESGYIDKILPVEEIYSELAGLFKEAP